MKKRTKAILFTTLGASLLFGQQQASAEGNVYTIQKGDTLYGIAKEYNIDMHQLAEVNGIDLADFIHPNQELTIPNGGYEEVTTAPNTPVAPVDDIQLLYAIVQQEGGYNYDSAVAVMSTIQNRVEDGRFGNGYTGVIKQAGQFASYGDGDYIKHLGNITQDTINAVNYVLNNGSTHGYLFFWSDEYASMKGQGGVNIGGNVFFNM